jgi:hypothetical protein
VPRTDRAREAGCPNGNRCKLRDRSRVERLERVREAGQRSHSASAAIRTVAR